jgi:NAD(P)H dehydrogenase (quinone)
MDPDPTNADPASGVRVAVVHYSSTGSVYALAEAVADGARSVGADTRVLRVAELAPAEAIDANPDWRAHLESVEGRLDEATLDDLEWADAFAFGTPTRFGLVAAQLKQFLDQTGGLWQSGQLADKAATAFTSALNAHGGQETTLVSLYHLFSHWGCIIVPPGYTDDRVSAAGGNPYGASHTAGPGNDAPDDAMLDAARHQGERLALVAARLTSAS